jgi:hypothetical protein
MPLQSALASYVATLERCLASTHRAEDRCLYEKYLVGAGTLLAACILGEPIDALNDRIKDHDRTWGHTWLQDPIYREAASAWSAAKEEARKVAT